MIRRVIRQHLLTLAFLAVAATACAQPSITVVMADDLRVSDLDLMPRLTELAAQGVRFDAAFTPSPLCTPARVSLLTGRLPRNHGVWSNDPSGFNASDTIATRLQIAGYRTGQAGKMFNKMHLAPLMPGWDEMRVLARHDALGAETQTDTVARWALECMAGSRPFFCYVAPIAPHGPLGGPARCASEPAPSKPEGFGSDDRWRRRMSAICGLDDLIASVVAARQPGDWVVFTADNGFMYGENGRVGKNELVLDAAQVPLVIWGPDVTPARRRELVSLVDVSATTLRVANVGRSGLDGQSLLPLLVRPDPDVRWTGQLEVAVTP